MAVAPVNLNNYAITQKYLEDDAFAQATYSRGYHAGIDLAVPSGTPLVAPRAGVVEFIPEANAYGLGQTVFIRHSDGTGTILGHLSSFNGELSSGQQISEGTTVGFSGNTGVGTGAHLDWRMGVGSTFGEVLNQDISPTQYLANNYNFNPPAGESAYTKATSNYSPGGQAALSNVQPTQSGSNSSGNGGDIFLEQLDAFQAALRTQESSNNYTAIGPQTSYGTAKGAYQFLDETWRNALADYNASVTDGGFPSYSTADQAPKNVQDAVARREFTKFYNRYGGNWALVATAWHGGPGTADRAYAGEDIGGVYDAAAGIYTSAYAQQVVDRAGLSGVSGGPTGTFDLGDNVTFTPAQPDAAPDGIPTQNPNYRTVQIPDVSIDFDANGNPLFRSEDREISFDDFDIEGFINDFGLNEFSKQELSDWVRNLDNLSAPVRNELLRTIDTIEGSTAPILASIAQASALNDRSLSDAEGFSERALANNASNVEAEQAALEQARINQFRNINNQATARGLQFSGVPIEEQSRFIGETYLPSLSAIATQGLANEGQIISDLTNARTQFAGDNVALSAQGADIQNNAAQQRVATQQAIADLASNNFNNAQGLYGNQIGIQNSLLGLEGAQLSNQQNRDNISAQREFTNLDLDSALVGLDEAILRNAGIQDTNLTNQELARIGLANEQLQQQGLADELEVSRIIADYNLQRQALQNEGLLSEIVDNELYRTFQQNIAQLDVEAARLRNQGIEAEVAANQALSNVFGDFSNQQPGGGVSTDGTTGLGGSASYLIEQGIVEQREDGLYYVNTNTPFNPGL